MLVAACTNPQPSALPSSSPTKSAQSIPLTNLHITGSLRASTNPNAGPNQCQLNQPSRGQLTIAIPGMSLSDGQVLRVKMTTGATPGVFSAVVPAVEGVTPVRVERLANSGGGAVTGLWTSTSGTVRVDVADTRAGSATYGVASGRVDTQLALTNGAQPIDLHGTWGCSHSINV